MVVRTPRRRARLVGFTDRAVVLFNDRLLAILWNASLRRRGVDMGAAERVLGRPIVSLASGSSVSIGDRSVLISRPAATALGVARPVILRTLRTGARIEIGADVGMSGTTVCAATSITIGDRVLFGADVVVSDTDFHAIDAIPRRYEPLPESKPTDAVVIGSDAFVGARSIVLKGAVIGSGSVIGAGSVVTGTIPEGVVAAGNPCRVIRPLPPQGSRELLAAQGERDRT